MHTTQMQAFSDELQKIAEAHDHAELLAYFELPLEKSAGHFDDQSKKRAAEGAERLAAEHARQIQDGLGRLNQEHGNVIRDHFQHGDAFHIDMPGGLKALVQNIGGEFIAKTGLKTDWGSTSKGDFQTALKEALRKSTRSR